MKSLLILSLLALYGVCLRSQTTLDVCAGDTLVLEVTVPLNVNVQWQQSLDSIQYFDIPGANLSVWTLNGIMTTRHFRALFTGPLCDPYYSEIKTVLVHTPPSVAITGLDPAYCLTQGPVSVTGTPPGGTFNGTGMTGATFDPGVAGTGTHQITYIYSSSFGCKGIVSQPVTVVPPPTPANAGPDIPATSTTVTLAANAPLSGTGAWSIITGTGGSFSSAFIPNANFTGNPNAVYTLVWTISNPPCASSTDTVVVTMPTGPTLPSVSCGSPSYTMYVHPIDNAGPTLWGCAGFASGATDQNNGAANTTLIVQMCGQGTAAFVCDNLTAYGYSDWYLPSYNELECVRLNAVSIGGFAADKYWSSTEGAGILYLNAYYRTFPSGVSGAGSKSSVQARVRCVRKD